MGGGAGDGGAVGFGFSVRRDPVACLSASSCPQWPMGPKAENLREQAHPTTHTHTHTHTHIHDERDKQALQRR